MLLLQDMQQQNSSHRLWGTRSSGGGQQRTCRLGGQPLGRLVELVRPAVVALCITVNQVHLLHNDNILRILAQAIQFLPKLMLAHGQYKHCCPILAHGGHPRVFPHVTHADETAASIVQTGLRQEDEETFTYLSQPRKPWNWHDMRTWPVPRLGLASGVCHLPSCSLPGHRDSLSSLRTLLLRWGNACALNCCRCSQLGKASRSQPV